MASENQFPITLTGDAILAGGHQVLSAVPAAVTATAVPNGCFIGLRSASPSHRHVSHIGKLQNIPFLSIFRFKVWWTTQLTGSSGHHLENETQMILLDRSPSGRPYVVLLPIIENSFRSTLQPNPNSSTDFIDICIESGSTKVIASDFSSVLYLHAAADPYAAVSAAVAAVRRRLGTFRLLREKSPPRMADGFGWCTWDAFYLKVHPEGVAAGVRELAEAGVPPRTVVIDDGWQAVRRDGAAGEEDVDLVAAGEQMGCRMACFEENVKFREYVGENGEVGLGAFVGDLKKEFEEVESVYVWHALCGYWGGVRPEAGGGVPGSVVVSPVLSQGVKGTMEDCAVDKIVRNGVGVVHPDRAGELYEGLHSRLAASGVDGVKVDVIHILEMVCEEYGGRVEMAKGYYKALTASIRKHFGGNGVLASMEHCNDFMLLGTEAISMGRVGDDFWCTDPMGDPKGTYWLQGCHMVHCAYNSLWMGNFILPDWDMFQSTHPCAAFHAASRAVSGGPLYISDSLGNHNFDLLRRLVLPDGSILRCRLYALPTRDCLFNDPLHDGRTVLKIWNLNQHTGVVGAFNCQGGGWCKEERRNKCAAEFSGELTATISPSDIEWTSEIVPELSVKKVDMFAVYLLETQELLVMKLLEKTKIVLRPYHFQLAVITPVLSVGFSNFAVLGLVNMLNCGGAVKKVAVNEDRRSVEVSVKGTGEMKAFSSERPVACRIDGQDVMVGYEDLLVTVHVAWPEDGAVSVIEYLFL